MRIFWLIIGGASLTFGTLGIFLPLLPTVPFYLLAAYGFSKSSAKFHSWLINHNIFGPDIRAWNENRIIKRRSKLTASAAMAGAVVLAVIIGIPVIFIAIQTSILVAVAIFLWRQNES